MGKQGYMAPEMMSRQGVAGAALAACDVYSLGICLFITLYGCPPYMRPVSSDRNYRIFQHGRVLQLLDVWGSPRFDEVSDLLQGMLHTDAPLRTALAEVCAHPWLDLA